MTRELPAHQQFDLEIEGSEQMERICLKDELLIKNSQNEYVLLSEKLNVQNPTQYHSQYFETLIRNMNHSREYEWPRSKTMSDHGDGCQQMKPHGFYLKSPRLLHRVPNDL